MNSRTPNLQNHLNHPSYSSIMYRLIVCVIFGLILALSCADALRCYQCFNSDRGPCFSPTSSNSSVETCTAQQLSRSFPPELQNALSFSEAEARSDAFSSGDIRCYHYQTRQLLTNRTEVHRGCLTANNADMLCNILQSNGPLLYYNLTTCRTCNHDLCNSSTRPGLTFFAPASFLATIFILNKFH